MIPIKAVMKITAFLFAPPSRVPEKRHVSACSKSQTYGFPLASRVPET
jgi:hypothetical protein